MSIVHAQTIVTQNLACKPTCRQLTVDQLWL